MSPLAILYFLLASSPVYNNWHHESPSSWSSKWAFPSTFEKSCDMENSGRFFESMMPFESLFNNEWTHESPRSLIREMTGLEVPSMFESRHFEHDLELSPIFRAIKLIKRIAKVNPILIEKLLTRPETRFAVESLLRTVVAHPESHHLIRKVVKSILSHKMSRRSIVNEMYPTSTFESTPFSTLFNVEEPMTRIMIEKVIRHAEVARLVKKLIKKSIFGAERRSIISELYPTRHFESKTTPFSTLFNVEEPTMIRHLIEKVLRNPIVLSKVIRRLVKSTPFEHEHESIFSHKNIRPIELLSTLSHVEPKMIAKIVKKALRHELPVEVVLAKVIRRLVKSTPFEHEHESIFSHEKVHPIELLSTLSHVEPKMIKKIEKVLRNPIVLSKVIRRLVKSTPFEHESIFSHKNVEHKMIAKIVKKALRHELPVEVVLAKVIRRLIKSTPFEHEHESIFSTRRHHSTKNVEEVCHVCESVCEKPEHIFESKNTFSTKKVCRVCAEVCPTFAGRHHFNLERLVRPTVAPVFGRHHFAGLEHFDF